MVMVAVVARREGMARQKFGGFAAIGRAFVHCFFAIMTPAVILGGMFSGWFTPTEAAAVACLYALFLGFVVYRTLHWKQLGPILVDTAVTTGVVMVLVMSAAALGWCISISRVPQTLTPIILAAFDSPLMFLLFVNVLLLVIGCFMEALAAMLILIPILAPAAASYGIDPVQFGVIVVLNLIIGTITPPMGVVLFVVTRIAEIRFEVMARAIVPWLVPLLAVLAAITLWPGLTLWVPTAMRGG
jgi:tripartite ATP-independent transporter DctM subunit